MDARDLRIGNNIYSKELDINNGSYFMDIACVDYYIISEMIRGNICPLNEFIYENNKEQQRNRDINIR